ncbi:MAG: hypothetical protein KDA50_07135 [Rhodobacteraceae bacterium]|nr:hypothetical protein [Paracoccaceae bacterium]
MSNNRPLSRFRGQPSAPQTSFTQKPLIGLDRSLLGTVDRFELKDGILKLEGWAVCDALTLHLASRDIPIDDRFPREDVADIAGEAQSKTAGFAAMTGWDDGPVRLSLDTGSTVYVFEIFNL